MEKFTAEKLKELVIHLNKRYSNENGYVSGILSEIDDWAYEHDIENDIEVDTQYCRMEEITDGLWEYVGVDAVFENEYDNRYYIVDITTEGGGICIYCAHAVEEDF